MSKIKRFNDFIKENVDNQVFLGFHSSRRDLKDGLYKASTLDTDTYEDVIRNAYMDIISDYDEYLETDDYQGMNDVFKSKGYGFTFVSNKPIEASSFQYTKYKYGDNLYEVYGDGTEMLLDDPNEIGANIVVTKNPLYFKKI